MNNLYLILQENLNILIIMTYVYVLYAFDFKENSNYLLGITLVTMYMLYRYGSRKYIEGLTGSAIDIPESERATTTEREDEILKRIEIRKIKKKCEDGNADLTEEEKKICKDEKSLSSAEEERIMDAIKSSRKNFIEEVKKNESSFSPSPSPSPPASNPGESKPEETTTNDSSKKDSTPSNKKLKELEEKISSIEDSLTQWYPWSNAEVQLANLTNEIRSLKTEDEIEESDNEIVSSLLYSKPDSVDDIKMYESIGKYDSICMKDMLTSFDEEELEPSGDLSMFLNNRVSVECCEDSSYSTTNGCICITENQKNNIYDRSGNK